MRRCTENVCVAEGSPCPLLGVLAVACAPWSLPSGCPSPHLPAASIGMIDLFCQTSHKKKAKTLVIRKKQMVF